MATALATNNILAVHLHTNESGQAAVNTFHYRVASVGAPPATDQDVAATFDTGVAVPVKAIMVNSASYRGVIVRIIYPPPAAADVISNLAVGAGVAGVVAQPRQVTGLTSWYTQFSGSRFRGRTYWPWTAANDVIGNGEPTGSYVTRVGTLSTFILNLSAIAVGGRSATLARILWHRDLFTYNDITSKVDRPNFATQRRRGDYGSGNVSPL